MGIKKQVNTLNNWTILKLKVTYRCKNRRSFVDLINKVEDCGNCQPFPGVDSPISVDGLLVGAEVVADLQ